MKKVFVAIGVVVGIFFLLAGVTATSLVGEVVTLSTRAEDGSWQTTPLWIVESGGSDYLRAGQPDGSGWVTRLRANPEVRLERGGTTTDVRLVPDESMRDAINAAMAERYGWADGFVGLMGDRSVSLPYRVEPAVKSAH